MKILKGFSAIDNYQKLKSFTPRTEYMFIHMQKVVFMTLVTFVHQIVHLAPQVFDSYRVEIVSWIVRTYLEKGIHGPLYLVPTLKIISLILDHINEMWDIFSWRYAIGDMCDWNIHQESLVFSTRNIFRLQDVVHMEPNWEILNYILYPFSEIWYTVHHRISYRSSRHILLF